MAPGLTSEGGRLPTGEEGAGEEEAGAEKIRYGGRHLEEGEVVIIEAEGKEEACLVGRLKMGTKEIVEKKKGVVMDQGHYLGDGLWRLVID